MVPAAAFPSGTRAWSSPAKWPGLQKRGGLAIRGASFTHQNGSKARSSSTLPGSGPNWLFSELHNRDQLATDPGEVRPAVRLLLLLPANHHTLHRSRSPLHDGRRLYLNYRQWRPEKVGTRHTGNIRKVGQKWPSLHNGFKDHLDRGTGGLIRRPIRRRQNPSPGINIS